MLVFLCIVIKLIFIILGVFFFFCCNYKFGKRFIIFLFVVSDFIIFMRRGFFFIGGVFIDIKKKIDNWLDVLVYIYIF